MFKFMKQGISLAAAVAAAGSCIPVYAAGIQPRTSVMAPDGAENKGTSITIAEPVEGHRYKVYQVFKGRVSSDGTKLSNVEYGANYSGREGVALKDELAQLETEGAEAKAFAETVRDLLKGEPAAVLSTENPTVELEAGYYMILDETLYEVDGDSLSDYIVTVAGNVTVQPKSTGVPEFDKSIDDGKGDNGGTPDTEEPDVPPAEVPEDADISPETADIDWNYTLDEAAGEITLNYYIGTKTDVKVYSHYRVPGSDRVYKALLKTNDYVSGNMPPYMFLDRDDIETIVFSDKLDTTTCTDMGSMFHGCSSLTDIQFGSAFDTSNVTDMSHMFNECSSLASLDVSGFNTGKVTDMNGMFYLCNSLEALDVTGFDTSSATRLDYMFYKCTSLTALDVTHMNTANVTDLSFMFAYCSNVKAIDVSRFDTSNVISLTGMFQYCKITGVDMSEWSTNKLQYMQQMFQGCAALTSVDFTNFNVSRVRQMHFLFNNCTSLRDVKFPEFSPMNFVNLQTGESMFDGCSSLEELDMTGFVLANATNLKNMFRNCNSLWIIYVSEGWEYNQSVASGMFDNCNAYTQQQSNLSARALSDTGILGEAHAAEPDAGAGSEPGETDSEEYIEVEGDDTSVEYGIGDSIPYKLTATMPESITAYEKYVLAFHDKLSVGLDYDRDSLKVFAGDTEIPAEHYTVTYSEDGKSMTVSIADVKAAPWNAVPGTQIIVKYSAVLNENAQAGNTNEAFLEYSNDPKGDGTGTTGPGVPDVVTVYTFELRFDKVDKNGNALEGAGFTLYKKNDAGEFVPTGDEIKGLTRFSFKGLAAGEYKLVETTTPDGYNTMEDLYFNIVAEETESGGETVKRISIEAPDGSPLSGWTAIGADKAFESDIANYTGSTLPETGGTGTYLLYAAGVAVVITAGTVIAARKKADEE